MWWPFNGKRVAPDTGRITVARKRPRVNDLAALLSDRAQFDERAVRFEAKLFLKLPFRRLKQVFPEMGFALRDGPDAGVLALPQWPHGHLVRSEERRVGKEGRSR